MNYLICVNDDAEYYLPINAQRSFKQLGKKEGDTIVCEHVEAARIRTAIDDDDDSEEGGGESFSRSPIKPAVPRPRNARIQRNGKEKRRSKPFLNPSLANQWPSDQQLKEAHSKLMEPVLSEIRSHLRRIRQQQSP